MNAINWKRSILITTARPRCAAYQVLRYVDGPKLLLTCTRRGIVRIWELYLEPTKRPDVLVERARPLHGDDASAALNRAIAAGYDVIRVSDELKARAGARRRAA